MTGHDIPFVVLGRPLAHDTGREPFWRASDALDLAERAAAAEAHWVAALAIAGRPLADVDVAAYRKAVAAEDYARAVYAAEAGR